MDPAQALTLSTDLACPQDSLCDGIFDFLPFKDYPDPDNTAPASCLHLPGFAKEWIAWSTVVDPFFAAGDDNDLSITSCPSLSSDMSNNSSITELDCAKANIPCFASQVSVPPTLEQVYAYLSSQH